MQSTRIEKIRIEKIRIAKLALVFTTIIYLWMTIPPAVSQSTTGGVRLQAGIAKEEVDGDLKSAIEIYQKIADDRSAPRDLRSRALLRLAGCYEKLGQQAQKVYEQVLREFGDQREQAAIARQRLAAINGAATAKTPGESQHRIPVPASASIATSDGRHVFYVDRAAGGLVVTQMDGSDPRLILPLPDRRATIPSGPTISPDGTRLAIRLSTADRHSYAVVGVDGSGFRELYVIPPSVQPVGAWSPDGRTIIAHPIEADGSYSLATIDVQDGSLYKINNDPGVRGDFALGTGGHGIFSPDGKYIVFAVRPTSGLQSNIRIVAVDGSYQGKLVDHPSWNNPLGFAPDGKHFLFQSDRSGQPGIYAILVAAGKAQGEPVLIKKLAGISALGTFLSRNGTFYYTVGEGDHGAHEAFTLHFDPATGKTAGNPQLLSGPAGFIPESAAWSPDGERLALISGKYHEHYGGEVMLTVRKLATGQDAEWKIPPETSAVAGWAADGSEVYTAVQLTGRLELHAISATTGESRTLSVIPGARVIYCVRPAPEPNALLISYGQQPPAPGRPAGLIRQDLQTGRQTEIVPQGVASEITMSPDGKQLAALDRQPKSAGIMVKPLEGGDWKTLATLEGTGYMYLHWLPNGDLLFGREGLPDSSIFRLPASGGAPQKIADLKSLEHVHEIKVSPDGRQLLFQSYVNNIEFWALENFLPEEFMKP